MTAAPLVDGGNARPTPSVAKLGAVRCATMTCVSLETAIIFYADALGFVVVERGTVSVAMAEHWRAPACAGANTLLMCQPDGGGTFLRFVEDQDAVVPTPYNTLGWAALEFSVQSSDAAVKAAEDSGFRVIGAAQDLAFSEGALRAGQVAGVFGEVLYFTEIRAQLDNYTLPIATVPIGPMFIVISAVPSVADSYSEYASRFGMAARDPFDAEVPFIASYQGKAADTSFHFGCLELVPESYVEVDEVGPEVPRRARPYGKLPAGIAIISFASPVLAPFLLHDEAIAAKPVGHLYDGRRSVVVEGPYGELIEIIETVVVADPGQ